MEVELSHAHAVPSLGTSLQPSPVTFTSFQTTVESCQSGQDRLSGHGSRIRKDGLGSAQTVKDQDRRSGQNTTSGQDSPARGQVGTYQLTYRLIYG
jgi:hypothetical protein